MDDRYRSVFGSKLGSEVLADILAMCHFGASLDPDNKAQIAEYNVGVAILAKCGALRDDNMLSVLRTMINGADNAC